MVEDVSKYCYDNGTLINKFGIMDKRELERIERETTIFKITNLVKGMRAYINEENISNKELGDFVSSLYKRLFSVNGYVLIHKYLFGNIYDFAGEIRDEAIYKSNEPYYHNVTPFCYPSEIFYNLNGNLRDMSDYCGRLRSREDLLFFISKYYGEINVIHPFREGNGRALRTFMVLIVDYLSNINPNLNYELQYSLWTKENREELLKATIDCSLKCDYSGIMECFDKVLVSKDKKKKSR